MGKKHEGLEMCAHLQDYGIMETWWDASYDWSVGYGLFRKDRQRRQGGCAVLCVNDQLKCMKLHLGLD